MQNSDETQPTWTALWEEGPAEEAPTELVYGESKALHDFQGTEQDPWRERLASEQFFEAAALLTKGKRQDQRDCVFMGKVTARRQWGVFFVCDGYTEWKPVDFVRQGLEEGLLCILPQLEEDPANYKEILGKLITNLDDRLLQEMRNPDNKVMSNLNAMQKAEAYVTCTLLLAEKDDDEDHCTLYVASLGNCRLCMEGGCWTTPVHEPTSSAGQEHRESARENPKGRCHLSEKGTSIFVTRCFGGAMWKETVRKGGALVTAEPFLEKRSLSTKHRRVVLGSSGLFGALGQPHDSLSLINPKNGHACPQQASGALYRHASKRGGAPDDNLALLVVDFPLAKRSRSA